MSTLEYSDFAVDLFDRKSISSTRYTTVTIPDETGAKFTEVIIEHDFKSTSDAIDYVADITWGPEALQKLN
jgi:hypothetical protein